MKHQLIMLELSETKLDWRNTQIPTSEQLRDYFDKHNIETGRISPQANGTIIMFAASDPRDVWKNFSDDDLKPQSISQMEIWYAKLQSGTATQQDRDDATAFLLKRQLMA